MPKFERPPDWWVNLANLTDWFEWPAIAAFLTALVLWNTARLADRARRESRMKDGAFVLGVSHELNAVIGSAMAFKADGAKEKEEVRNSAATAVAVLTRLNVKERLEGIPLSNFPTAETFEKFQVAKVVAEHLMVILERVPTHGFKKADFDQKLATLQRYRSELREMGALMAREPWETRLRQQFIEALKSLSSKLRATWKRLPFVKLLQQASKKPNV